MYDIVAIYNRPRDVYDIVIMNSINHCDVVIIDDDDDDMIVLDHCDDMIVIDHCDEAAAAAVGTAPDEGIKEFFDRHGNVLYYHVFLIIHFIYKH